MKHLFLINPAAGKYDHTAQITQKVRALCEPRGLDYAIRVSKQPGDCTRMAREAAASGSPARIYACGGDGTLNEVVNGAAGADNLAVTHFLGGSGNDFIKIFHKPEAFEDLQALLDDPDETMLDLIQVGEDYGVNIVSMGIDARIGTEVHKYSGIPLVGGTGAYIVSAVANVFKGINRPMKLRVGDYTAEGEHALVCACNGRFYGGGFNPSLTARPDDGILDIYVVKGVSLFALARYIGKYASGKGENYPRYITHLRGDSLHIEFEEDNVINIDGEAMSARTVDMKLLPGALRLIVPKGMRFFEDSAR